MRRRLLLLNVTKQNRKRRLPLRHKDDDDRRTTRCRVWTWDQAVLALRLHPGLRHVEYSSATAAGLLYHFKRARVNAIPRRSQRFRRQRFPLGISERNASARPAGCALSSPPLRTYWLDYHSGKLVVEFGKKKVWLSPLVVLCGGRAHKREQAALERPPDSGAHPAIASYYCKPARSVASSSPERGPTSWPARGSATASGPPSLPRSRRRGSHSLAVTFLKNGQTVDVGLVESPSGSAPSRPRSWATCLIDLSRIRWAVTSRSLEREFAAAAQRAEEPVHVVAECPTDTDEMPSETLFSSVTLEPSEKRGRRR